MDKQIPSEHNIIEKLRSLPTEKIAEVEDFIDFLCARSKQQSLTEAATKLSEAAFSKVWDNAEDALYDNL